MITKQETEHLTILPDGQIQVKKYTKIFEDDVFIAQNIHSRVVAPGDTVDPGKEPRAAKAIQSFHDQKTIDDYKAAQDAQLAKEAAKFKKD